MDNKSREDLMVEGVRHFISLGYSEQEARHLALHRVTVETETDELWRAIVEVSMPAPVPVPPMERGLIIVTANNPATLTQVSVRRLYLWPMDPEQRKQIEQEDTTRIQREMLQGFSDLRASFIEWSVSIERDPDVEEQS